MKASQGLHNKGLKTPHEQKGVWSLPGAIRGGEQQRLPQGKQPRHHFPKAGDTGPSMSASSKRRRLCTRAVEREAIRRGEEAVL